jgi:hypothetical protein
MASDVEFDTDIQNNPRTYPRNNLGIPTAMTTSQRRGMAGWLVKKGVAKDESQATSILVGVMIVNLILIALILYYALSPSGFFPTKPQQPPTPHGLHTRYQ